MKLRSGTMTDSKDIKIGVVGDSSYVKLSMYDGSGNVRLWLNSAERCIKIKGLKNDSAASYLLYHLIGQARIEVLMLGEDLTKVDKIKIALCDRFELESSANEIIYRIMARKQGMEEGMIEYLDVMLGLGLEFKQLEEKWEGVVVESIRKNVRSSELRRSLINKRELSFKDIREYIRRWDMVEEDVNCYTLKESRETRKDIEVNKVSGSDLTRGYDEGHRIIGNDDMNRGSYGEYRSRGYSDAHRGSYERFRDGENSDISRRGYEGHGGRIYNNIVRGHNNRGATYMGWRGDGIGRQKMYSTREPIQCYKCGMNGHLGRFCRNFYDVPN